jgi:methyl-accepting chemotaxis protein
MSTKNKKNQKETVFPENQVMMMLESMQDGIEVIAENQQGLRDDFNDFKIETRKNFKKVNQKLDKHEKHLKRHDQEFKKVNQKLDKQEKHLKEHDKKFEQIDKRFEQVDKRFEQVDKNFEKVDKNFEKVFTSLAEIKQEVQDIRKELDQMKNQPVIRREEFELLVKRVERVEMSIER